MPLPMLQNHRVPRGLSVGSEGGSVDCRAVAENRGSRLRGNDGVGDGRWGGCADASATAIGCGPDAMTRRQDTPDRGPDQGDIQ